MKRVATAMVFTGPGQPLQFRTFPVAEPVGEEVLVRVRLVYAVRQRPAHLRGPSIGPNPVDPRPRDPWPDCGGGPHASGQDAAGQALRLEDRVTWSITASCGKCFYCRRQLPQKCAVVVKYGHEPLREGAELTGGLADYRLLAPGTTNLRRPNHLPDETACPASCATATVAAALRSAGDLEDRTVLVQGAGMLGLTAWRCRAWPARRR